VKKRTLMMILIAAAACDAQVVTLTGYVYQPGASPATRYPARSASASHFAQIYYSANQGPVTPGQRNEPVATTVPKEDPTIYALGFITVSGGLQGDITLFPDSTGNFPLSVPVDIPNTPAPTIAVQAFYFPVSCPSNTGCGTEASIDEYSDTSNKLLEDWFVSVFAPPSALMSNGGLNTTANDSGTVTTTSQSVRINADPTTTTGGTFDRWVEWPGGTINNANLNVKQNSSVYALAFYHSVCPANYVWSPSATISQCAPPSQCQQFLTSLDSQIAAKKVPVQAVPGDRSELGICLQTGQITAAQYSTTLAALNSLKN
jgi:hypothetical protein